MMPSAPAADRAPHPGFRYIAGDPALDLVNTVVWSRRLLNERLTDYAALTRWAEGAGLLSRPAARRLRRAARSHPRQAAAVLDAARTFRETLQRTFASLARGRTPRRDLARLDAAVAAALEHRRLAERQPARGSGSPVEWRWTGEADRLDAFLWPVALAAAALLVSDEVRRVRVCAGRECGWMYVDRSRNGLRRWCEMETCGTLEKTRRRARNRRFATPG